ncbi:MAG TPA: NADH-quinone oxidoreductase subunit C [Candidatus Saccharimonadia bacterium]|nr:NADH-quinone oxidoreductase subunit C [Candidatus Saccharimonadia bacterium]
MPEPTTSFPERLAARFGDRLARATDALGQVAIDVAPEHLLEVARALRDEFKFEVLIDLCGIDYLGYGEDEWDTKDVSSEGFSRGVEGEGGPGRFAWGDRPKRAMVRRFASVVHLLSVANNERIRIRSFCADDFAPTVPTLVEVWSASNWFEREAFDLFGIVYDGHPDLRRLLTDYGFVGHPFRKDFPLIGNVEVRYDAEKGRVVYEPVSIEPRVLVPRTLRDDSRYLQAKAERPPPQARADQSPSPARVAPPAKTP